MNRIFVIIGLAVIVGVGYVSYRFGYEQGEDAGGSEARDPFADSGKEDVFALGRIEPKGGIVNVGGIPGETIASLWNEPDDDTAQKTSSESNASSENTAEEGEALATLKGSELAAENLRIAQANLERLKGLSKDLISPQQIEQQQLAVQQAQLQLDRTRIAAPISGTVLRTFVRVGEMIGREPVAQMADLDHMVVVAEVYEMHVKHVEVGQTAKITSRAFHDPYDANGLKGKVIEIGKIIAAPQINTFNPLARADRHVVEVRIELDKESAKEAAKLINLEVEVEIETAGS